MNEYFHNQDSQRKNVINLSELGGYCKHRLLNLTENITMC